MEIEPGLMSRDELKKVLENKGVKLNNCQSKQELVELYIKFVKPQPQRIKKSEKHEQTKVVSLKLEKISLSEALERREKRFKNDFGGDHEMLDLESSPKKSNLKRQYKINKNEIIDDIKKIKFN